MASQFFKNCVKITQKSFDARISVKFVRRKNGEHFFKDFVKFTQKSFDGGNSKEKGLEHQQRFFESRWWNSVNFEKFNKCLNSIKKSLDGGDFEKRGSIN